VGCAIAWIVSNTKAQKPISSFFLMLVSFDNKFAVINV